MPEESVLIGLSQLGAVFAGFIAIFTAFVQRDGRFSPVESLRARSMLYASFLTVLASLLPLLLSAFGVMGNDVWRFSAVLFLVLGIGAPIDAARHNLALKGSERRGVGRVHFFITWGLTVATIGVLGQIALGYGDAGHYLLCLAMMLCIAASNFLTSTLLRLL